MNKLRWMPGIGLAVLILSILVTQFSVKAADCTWFGGDGAWSDPTNWSGCGGNAPGANDTAVINAGTVSLDITVTVAGLTMSGGTLTGSQTLTVTDHLLLTGEANKTIAGITLNNEGTGIWNDGTFTLGPWPAPLTFNNQAGATFAIVGERNTQPSQASIIANYGTMIKSGEGLSDIANLGAALHNYGLVRVEEGELRVQGGNHTHAGAFEALSGATMQFDGAQHFGPTASITGDGNVGFIRNGGGLVLDYDMTYNIGGRTTISCFGCAVRFHAAAVTGELALLPWEGQFPQIEGEGSVTVTGQTLWHQGVIGHTGNYFNNGPITVEMQGGLTLYGLSSHIMHDAIIRNHGEAVYNAGSFFIRYPTAHFINLPGASFEMEGPRDIDYRWGGEDLPLGRFVNLGELIKSGAGDAFFSGVILENSGDVDVAEGRLVFRRSLSGANTTGGRLMLSPAGTITSDEPIRIEEYGWLTGNGVVDGPVEVGGDLRPGFSGTPQEAGQVVINGNLTLESNGRFQTNLLNSTTPGVGHDQVVVNGAAIVDGQLEINLSLDYDPPMETEFTLLTCSQGCLGFFTDLIVTPDETYFQLLYQGDRIVARRVAEPPPPDDPIVGLQAATTSPAFVGESVLFAAAVSEGQSVLFRWHFEDGLTLYGSHVERIYSEAGVFGATVIALNPVSAASEELFVTINERPNFAGLVWHDVDGDGRFGLGETGLGDVTVTAVGPGGNLQTTADSGGLWRIDVETAGLYQLAAAYGNYTPTTPNPLSLPLPQAGSALTDFGLIDPAPPGQGRITGRVWADADADGFPSPFEIPFAGHSVTLWQNGTQVANITADSNGLFRFNGLTPGGYEVRAAAPAAHFPASISAEVTVSEGQFSNVMLGFLPGGTVGGSVRNPDGGGIPNIVVMLTGPGGTNTNATSGNGGYQFGPLAPGTYTLTLLPPPDYYPADGVLSREITVGSGFNPQDWTLNRLGRLSVYARAVWLGIGDIPVGGLAFTVAHESGGSSDHMTGPDGRITLDGLPPGVYTVTPDLDTVPPNTTISPASRTAVVAENTYAEAMFGINPAQSIRTICIRGLTNPPGASFPCTVEVRALQNGQPVDPPLYTAPVVGTGGYHMVIGLSAGSYEVSLVPDEENWPVYRENVVINAGNHAVVNYPYNPSPNVTDIRGYAYLDSNASHTRQCSLGECNDPAANGLTVNLYDTGYNLLATTETEQQNSTNSGFFRFQNLAAGTYLVAIEFPPGYFRTNDEVQERLVTLTVGVDEVLFGYRRLGDSVISGRAFLDNDGDALYQPSLDSPAGGLPIHLELLNGEPAAQTTTAPDGTFNFTGLSSGQYRVILADPPSGYSGHLEQVVALPEINAHVSVQFPLQPHDGQPRALVFLDGNGNGSPQMAEQRLAGVTVSLYDSACASLPLFAQPVATMATDSSGTVMFSNGLLTQPVGCVFASNLPAGVGPAQAGGTPIQVSGAIAWLPVQTLGSLTVQPFLDQNGNNAWDTGEPFLGGFNVTVSGHLQIGLTGPNGVTFNLGAGSYSVSVTPSSSGYQMAGNMPVMAVVNQGAATTLRLPVRSTGGIYGQVIGGNGGGGWVELSVQLQNVYTQQTWTTTSNPGYEFNNLPTGLYQLSLPQPPAGYLQGEAPLIVLNAGQSTQQNLFLYPIAAVSGLVYYDSNYNGSRDNGEPGTGAYGLTLLNDAGLPSQTIQPASNGAFNLTGLQVGVRYALTLDAATGTSRTTVSEAPGWFTLSSMPYDLRVGLYEMPNLEDEFTMSRYFGQVYTGQSHNRTPVAGARLIAYLWQQSSPAAEGCDQSNPIIWGEAFTDSNGNYWMFATFFPDLHYCLLVVDTPGVFQPNPAIVKAHGGWMTPNGWYYQPANVRRHIRQEFEPASGSSGQSTMSSAQIRWAAFRDDNGNGEWDAAETGLAGVEIGVSGASAVSNADGTGWAISLPAGEHLLTITPPDGYAVVGPAERTIYIHGADVVLPPIGLRLSGALVGSVFADNDGDGRQGVGGNEVGIGDVAVQVSGPAVASTVSEMTGRFILPSLPDGQYTITVTPPAGYAPLPPRFVTLVDGGVVSLPLQPTGLVVGVVYEDWDGDGRRAWDEPLMTTPITVTLGSVAESLLTAGQFTFWDPAPGSYSVTGLGDGVAEGSVTVGSTSGSSLALPAVSSGVVRGVIWHDANRDGVRQPWETPLSGVAVMLEGVGIEITDENGRFCFIDVAPGSYNLSVELPVGLSASPGTVVVGEGRGVAVGIPAVQPGAPAEARVYLPLIRKP